MPPEFTWHAPRAPDTRRRFPFRRYESSPCTAANVAAPNPLSNREMMRLVRVAVGAPFDLPATRWMLEVGTFLLRTETELVIKSRRVVPGRLLASGFEFRFPEFAHALRNLVT